MNHGLSLEFTEQKIIYFSNANWGALFQLSKKDKWEKIEFEHSIVDASISSDGELYIVSDGAVFRKSDNGFENLGQEGGFKSVEVVEEIIWALNNDNELFQLRDVTFLM